MGRSKESIMYRAVGEAIYMISTECTVRECATHFGVSKSTVHRDITCRIPTCYPQLAAQVEQLLKEHIEVRASRGGLATQRKRRMHADERSSRYAEA